MAFPHAPPPPLPPFPPQRIPRTIIQTGRSFSLAWTTHGRYMRSWSQLNPEYRYRFVDDAQAAALVRRRGTADERMAYQAVLTGAQKADIFRLLALKYGGGVYADVDSELRAPLRTAIDANASAVVGRYWTSEFMAYEAHHPILVEALRQVVANVLQQLRWAHALAVNGTDHPGRCHSPHSCVLMVTGPPVYMSAVSSLALREGCDSKGRLPAHRECRNARSEPIRRIQICSRDVGNVYRTWACNISKHWDCRNSGAARKCSKQHYSKARNFFNTSVMFGAEARPLGCQNERICPKPTQKRPHRGNRRRAD
ncbi:hypothetical protein AB1Y20_013104 [Prymnesium parvum]|uniref:Alpha-1,6-mannosyl-glycoprotein 6-beta-N-acetylglucosaminyltransferase n=1 Tax=Prymnesium parvum TaxID=97485 RepID=A0AB34IMM0_PRYPA